jgi:hypothetical protein
MQTMPVPERYTATLDAQYQLRVFQLDFQYNLSTITSVTE